MPPFEIKYHSRGFAPNGRERFFFLVTRHRKPPINPAPFEQWLDRNIGGNWYYIHHRHVGIELDVLSSWESNVLVILDRTNATMFMLSSHSKGYLDQDVA